MSRTFESSRSLSTLALTLWCASACGKEAADQPAERVSEAGEVAGGAKGEAKGEAAGERLFDPNDKSIQKRACEFLTADMVAAQFEVPAAKLEQMKTMGCIYVWREDGKLVDAKLMLLRVHKTPERAAVWLANATATKTKAEADAQMDQVKERVRERGELDSELEKNTAAELTEIAKLGTPDGGYSYEDVPGLGDAARVSNTDGVIWVRVGNLTFQVQAYAGPDQPKPNIDPKNLEGVAEAAMAAQKSWVAETLDQRKAAALKLAAAVVSAIAAAT